MSNWSKQLNNDNPRKIKDNAKKAQVQLWKKFLEIMFTIYIYIYINCFIIIFIKYTFFFWAT